MARFEFTAPEDVRAGDTIHANPAGKGMTVLEVRESGRSDYDGIWLVRTASGRETTVGWTRSTTIVRDVAK